MPVEPVETIPSLREVAVRLRETGNVELWKFTRKRMIVAVQPARPAIRASARATLPKRGGLNEWVAKSSINTSVLTGPRTAGVRLRVRKSTGKRHDMVDMDKGQIRHPVFGNREVWVDQTVPAGFATRPVKALTPAIEAACLLAMREAAAAAGFH